MVFIFWSFCLEFWNKIIYSGFNKFSGLSSIFFYSNVVNDGGSNWFDEGKYWCNEISIGIWNQNQTNKLKHVVDHVKLWTYNQTVSNVKVIKTFEIWKFPHPKYLTLTLKVPNTGCSLIAETCFSVNKMIIFWALRPETLDLEISLIYILISIFRFSYFSIKSSF